MSYDFSMKTNHCPLCDRYDEHGDLNYTYNVSPMFRLALGDSGVHQLAKMKAPEAIDLLDRGIRDMDRNPQAYEALNPSNGWGSFEGARMCLVTIKEWFEKYPDGTLIVE